MICEYLWVPMNLNFPVHSCDVRKMLQLLRGPNML